MRRDRNDHWTERLFEEQADVFAEFLERRSDRAADQVEGVLSLVAEERGLEPDSVLDVGCGIGSHLVEFAERGCRATGIDISERYVERARARAADSGVGDSVEVRVLDMRNVGSVDGEFDLATSFWNSLGYNDRETDVEILRSVRERLSPTGVLSIEMGNKGHTVRNLTDSSVREFEDRLHVDRREYHPETGVVETRIDVFDASAGDYEHVDTVEFRPRLYAPVELKELCEAAGFGRVSVYGGFDGSGIDLESPRTGSSLTTPTDAVLSPRTAVSAGSLRRRLPTDEGLSGSADNGHRAMSSR